MEQSVKEETKSEIESRLIEVKQEKRYNYSRG